MRHTTLWHATIMPVIVTIILDLPTALIIHLIDATMFTPAHLIMPHMLETECISINIITNDSIFTKDNKAGTTISLSYTLSCGTLISSYIH